VQPTQTEITDRLVPKQESGFISTGSYTVVTSSSIIRSIFVKNPKRGPHANANQNTYMTFRRVSDKSDENSWIHKGFEAHNFMEKALEESQVDKVFAECRDEFLSKGE